MSPFHIGLVLIIFSLMFIFFSLFIGGSWYYVGSGVVLAVFGSYLAVTNPYSK